jgi:uncharacterized protein YndB with AHSA1/START domain
MRDDDQPHERPQELCLTRVIDAPRGAVFAVWTTPEHLSRWWGPTGFTLPDCEMDFREGGTFRFHMRAPSGKDHWLRGVFREIVEPERIVFTFAWGTAEKRTGPETLVSVTLEESGGKTKLTLRQTGLASDTSAREHAEGWAEQLDRLAAYAPAARTG